MADQAQNMTNSSGKVQLAVFDIDGTVISGQSPAIVALSMVMRGRMKLGSAVKAGMWGIGYKIGFVEKTESVRRRVFKAFTSMSSQQADEMMRDIYQRRVLPRVREKAYDKIRWHQGRGDVVMFVSASFEPVVTALARDLDVDRQASTRMEVQDGSYTGEVDGKPVEGEEKALRLTAYADEHFGPGNWEVAYSYADHDTDVPVLSMARHPVAVNPKMRLERIAKREGWEIQHW